MSVTPTRSSSSRSRWLTALRVMHSSSAACVNERKRATASKAARPCSGGRRRGAVT
jgi:hypothetical protein